MKLIGRDRHTPLEWLRIDFGRDLDEVAVRGLILAIASHRTLGRVVLEAVAEKGQMHYRVGSANKLVLKSMIESNLPDSIVGSCDRDLPDHGAAWVVQSNTRRRSLATTAPDGASRRLLGSLLARPKATVVHQLVIGRRLRPIAVPLRLEEIPGETWPGSLLKAATTGRTKVDGEARRALSDKQSIPGAEVTLRVIVVQPDANSGAPAGYIAACRSLENPNVRFRLRSESWRNAELGAPGRKAMPCNIDEIVTLLGWPYGDASYPGLDRTGARVLIARQPEVSDRVIGTATHPGNEIELGQKLDDALRHLHVLGPTGVGKSTLLLNLILQDVETGRGAVVLDPKGDLVADVLARVSEESQDRLVVLDAARTDQIVGFNPLRTEKRSQELAVDGLLHVFHELHAASWGPRTQDILHNSLLTLIGSKYTTLCFIPQLLGDPSFRRRLLKGRDLHATLRFFWTWYDKLSEAERSSVIAPLMNKLRPFLLRSSLRGLIGQVQPRFDPKTVFTQRKVLLVPLHKGLIGSEATNLLGSLVVSRLWQLALERSSLPASQRDPVFFYLDEFQDYLRLPTDLSDVLAQARGLGIGLILAHQHLGQLNAGVRNAVMANAQSRICFRLGAEDANSVAKAAPELEQADLQSLGTYEIYAKLLSSGTPPPFASARTMPATKPIRSPELLAADLAKRWGRSLEEVDADLDAAATRVSAANESIGKKRRDDQNKNRKEDQ